MTTIADEFLPVEERDNTRSIAGYAKDETMERKMDGDVTSRGEVEIVAEIGSIYY